ncbi:hypothetical protein O1Q96_20905 [Streptomyces sp. Qhu-G9]|uniref:hypothetical protein n=1 Tax=Streptomyces sp. Qhu-G9 TaxID=3452799 RepID=UPI0022AC8106|nr:hypothetical protein [Streptomyces aurantiacus]WAU82025.1 hypothetical protein O1Q96_20905 [Streptomyces aurantiacus]
MDQRLGQPLARAELEIVLRQLCERRPHLRELDDAESLRFRDDSSVHGLRALRVAWRLGYVPPRGEIAWA